MKEEEKGSESAQLRLPRLTHGRFLPRATIKQPDTSRCRAGARMTQGVLTRSSQQVATRVVSYPSPTPSSPPSPLSQSHIVSRRGAPLSFLHRRPAWLSCARASRQ